MSVAVNVSVRWVSVKMMRRKRGWVGRAKLRSLNVFFPWGLRQGKHGGRVESTFAQLFVCRLVASRAQWEEVAGDKQQGYGKATLETKDSRACKPSLEYDGFDGFEGLG